MSPSPALDYDEVVTTIRSWSPARRLRLAEAILGSLRDEFGSSLPRGVPVEAVLGSAAGITPPPDDETVRRWIEERRSDKYQ